MKKIIAEADFTAEQLNIISALSAQTGLSSVTVKILYGRGIDTADKIKCFINPGKHRFINPLLMSGMKEAVELITRARDEEWSVVIYGDYDADGVCASTILCRCLADFGINAEVYIPERKNGYGLNVNSIDDIFEEYFPQLFITVDCGISNADEVEYIKEQGAEVIVTDHHELPDKLPDCTVINPKIQDLYPYDNLCGAGVAFKLGCAIIGKEAYNYLDFTAIATVADSVPLTGENRDIVAEGLAIINASPRKNYANFLKRDERANSQMLAFNVAPKINAAGRMGDACAALNLFLTDDERKIYDYSVKLTEYNVERQKYCDELYNSAKLKLKAKGLNGRVIVLWGENWNAGFVGIVAARLAEEYCRPALLFVKSGASLKGSVRSVDGVNIYDALKSCENLIEEFGGHSQAAGVKVLEENLPLLEEGLNKYLSENYSSDAFIPTHYINGELPATVSAQFIKELNLLEPFGVGNRKPLFAVDVQSCRVRPLKEGSQHLSVRCGGLDLLYFSGTKFSKLIKSSVPKRVIIDFGVSYFKGKEQVQGFLKDIVYYPESCAFAADEIKLNSVNLACGKDCGCKIMPITKAQAQELINGCGEYGTVFIACRLETLKSYDLHGLELNVFAPIAGNSASCVLLAPTADCDLSVYENIIFLDNPEKITLKSVAKKTVKVCTDISGFADLKTVDCQREQLLSLFKTISANSYNILGDGLEEIAMNTDFGVPPTQAYFALKVFEELGLLTFSGGRITVLRGVKTQLSNSDLYNFVNSES